VETDRPFELLSPLTKDITRLASGVAALDAPLGHGGDGAESGAEALYQIATGEGFVLEGTPVVARFDPGRAGSLGTVGGVGFRAGALRVVVHITDAPPHSPEDYGSDIPGTHGFPEASAALRDRGVHVVGIASGTEARPHLESLAIQTGAYRPAEGGSCATGTLGDEVRAIDDLCPLVFDIYPDGSGLSVAIIDALVGLVDQVRFREVFGSTSDDRLGFVQRIEASAAEPPSGITPPTRADIRPADGVKDTFVDVGVGTALDFLVHLQNNIVPPADYDQVFHLTVQILGDELVLVERQIRVTVPRGRLRGGEQLPAHDAGPDAGPDSGG
jgi:hypothetical protein